jgi:hypothetical protein
MGRLVPVVLACTGRGVLARYPSELAGKGHWGGERDRQRDVTYCYEPCVPCIADLCCPVGVRRATTAIPK